MWLARLPLEYIEKQDRSLPLLKNLKALCLLCIYLQRNKVSLISLLYTPNKVLPSFCWNFHLTLVHCHPIPPQYIPTLLNTPLEITSKLPTYWKNIPNCCIYNTCILYICSVIVIYLFQPSSLVCVSSF